MNQFKLPSAISDLVIARNRVREHYSIPGLTFTFDGKLVGDIGEAIAKELFGLTLRPGGGTGIDGHASDGRSVQVKATGTGRGAIFRHIDTKADHLIFLDINFETMAGEVVFNGPEKIALQHMPASWLGQRPVSNSRIRALDAMVKTHERLPRVDG